MWLFRFNLQIWKRKEEKKILNPLVKLEDNFTCVLSKSIVGDPVGSGKTAANVLLASYRTQNYFLCPITDKYSNKLWNWFVKISIPWALLSFLENFRLPFSWPNWPPLSFRGIFFEHNNRKTWYAPCLTPKIVHNHCLRFPLPRLWYPREIGNNGYVKFWG